MTQEIYDTASAWIDSEADRRGTIYGEEQLELWQERMTDALDACFTGTQDEAEETCHALDADPPPGYQDEDLVIVAGWLDGAHEGHSHVQELIEGSTGV